MISTKKMNTSNVLSVLLLIVQICCLKVVSSSSSSLSDTRMFLGNAISISGGGTKAYCPPSENLNNNETLSSSSLSSCEDNNINTNDNKKSVSKKRPMRILFLSGDTGGGHRASAEALAKEFQHQYPGSTYDLLDVWTLDGVYPYKTLVKSYTHMSARPMQWAMFYHLSNVFPIGIFANIHSNVMCGRRIKRRIAGYDPDVIISVHPAMNNAPRIAAQKLSEEYGKHIPFFTVVTDLGSGHSHWFEKKIERMYVASERIRKLARRRGRTPSQNIVMSGLPIRRDFAIEASKLNGDRTTSEGKKYIRQMKRRLKMSDEKPMVLVMGGGEGVGSLSEIVDELHTQFTSNNIDATICVVCAKNTKLRTELSERDWGNNVEVIGLGYVDKMADYMVAADILVTKAGPGTIAEAASVGLPVMLTSYLPGQEAGNVNIVLEAGFGEYNKKPKIIASRITTWLNDPDTLAKMSQKASASGHPTAAADIVRDIGTITQGWLETNLEAASDGKRKSILNSSQQTPSSSKLKKLLLPSSRRERQ